jgi:hypothetical protein
VLEIFGVLRAAVELRTRRPPSSSALAISGERMLRSGGSARSDGLVMP